MWCNSTLRRRISSFMAVVCGWGGCRLGVGDSNRDRMRAAHIVCDWLVVAVVVIFRGASCHFALTRLMQTHLERVARGTECSMQTRLERAARGTGEG
jgi:hypothetical protein